MMMRIFAVLSVVAVTFMSGCKDPVMAPHAGQMDLLPMQEYPRIVATSDLHKWLGFSRANEQAGPQTPLSVVVPVRVLADVAIDTQYRFLFFDGAGRQLKPEMTFVYKRLPARVQVFLEGAALDTNAVDWRLEIRTAR